MRVASRDGCTARQQLNSSSRHTSRGGMLVAGSAAGWWARQRLQELPIRDQSWASTQRLWDHQR